MLTLCDAPDVRGATWSTREVIVYTPDNSSGLMRVPAAGGTPSPVTDRNPSERSLRYPWFLPDGRHFLYSAVGQDLARSAIYVGDLDSADSKSRRLVASVNSNSAYAAPGYVLYARQGTLMAQPFDAGKLETTGAAVPVAEQVDYSGSAIIARFSVSQNGVLSYIAGRGQADTQLTWFDRTGQTGGEVDAPGNIRTGRISPDGRTVALERADPGGNYDLWLHDLARGSASRFTFAGGNFGPVWSPDGASIAFLSGRDGGKLQLYRKSASGTMPEQLLDKDHGRAYDWSRDGRYIIEGVQTSRTGFDLWVLPLFGDHKPFPYLNSEFYEAQARVSPNGQWLAYVSDESQRTEVYVATFPAPGGKWQVSTNGGTAPVWSRDGRELYFIGEDQKMMAADVKGSANKFEAGIPKPLFDVHLGGQAQEFDVGKDGRFLIPTAVQRSGNPPLTVVLN